MGFYRNFLQRLENQLKTSEWFSKSDAAKKERASCKANVLGLEFQKLRFWS